MATAALVGGTGLVGSHILSTICSHRGITSIDILARRNPPSTSSPQEKLTSFVDADTSKWAPHISTLSPPPSIFFSALATTRANAGSFENQYKLEHGVNIELARAAKEAGTKVYVLISAAGASKSSMFGYRKMKGEIEEDVKALGFDHTVIMKPGLIGGEREERRTGEAVVRSIASLAGKIHTGALKDGWAQDADVIARAAVSAGMQCLEGKAPEGKVWEIKAGEIIRLGRTEWVDSA